MTAVLITGLSLLLTVVLALTTAAHRNRTHN